MSRQTLSLIIPAYNEGARIKEAVEEVSHYFSTRNGLKLKEIIVVDDGSEDDTLKQVAACKVTCGSLVILENQQNQGKGAAVKKGVLEASGDSILFIDADLSTPLRCVDRLMDALENGADIAIGSRALKGSNLIQRQPLYRELSGRFFNLLVQLFFVGGFWDTQCGFKLFRADVGQRLFSQVRIKGFAFDVEFLRRAKASGCKIAEVPVEWINDPDSKVKMLRDPFFMIRDLFEVSAVDFFCRLRGVGNHARKEALQAQRNP
jgi:dolichyl-phosphate beta-glucosyltransferase